MLTLEQFERRDAPAAITLDAGVLKIVGTDAALEQVTVAQDGANITVDFKGVLPLASFPIADVDEIVVDMGDGYNRFSNHLPLGVPLTYFGGSGTDYYVGYANLVFFGGAGNDTALVFDGNAGRTAVLFGQGGNDHLRGGAGNDHINGGAGNDDLYGGAGVDVIRGGDGDDLIDGGIGADYLYGNDGADTFVPHNYWWSLAPVDAVVQQ